MNMQKKQEIIASLELAAQEIEQAQALFQNGELMHALKAIRQAKEYNERAVLALLGNCLNVVLSTAQSQDEQQREGCLPELRQLVYFSLAALCPRCRQQVSASMSAAIGKSA